MSRSQMTLYLQGGVGNQLFQACFYSFVRNYLDRPCKIDISLLNSDIPGVTARSFETPFLFDEGDIKANRSLTVTKARLLKKRLTRKLYIEDPVDVSRWAKEAFRGSHDVIGYFQDHVLVSEQWKVVRNKFYEVEPWSSIVEGALEDRIAIHYRLGDYVTNSAAQSFHGVTHPKFFLDAINALDPQGEKVIHLVTDSRQLAQTLLGSVGIDAERVVLAESQIGHLGDLFTLSHSTNLVISNSSFSWWGAWIASQKGARVVAPTPWFRTDGESPPLLPTSWIQMHRPLLSASQLAALQEEIIGATDPDEEAYFR
jgi:hypothetical protein